MLITIVRGLKLFNNLGKQMGCHSSKLNDIGIIDGSNKKTTKYKKKADCEAELMISYEEACCLIPELRCFGILPKLKKLVVNDQRLFFLAKEYLKNAVATMRLLSALKLSLSEVQNRQAIVLLALKCYEKEEVHRSFKKYPLTLSKLKEFKAAGDLFAALLTDEFASLCEQQQLVIKELTSKKDEIRQKLSSTKKWKKVLKVMFNAAFISVLITSVVLAALSAPLVATAAAAASGTAMKTAEQWFDLIWANRLDTLKSEKDIVLMMMKGEVGGRELETVRAMAKRLEIRIGSISGDAGFAVNHEEDEIAMEMAMEEIKSKVGVIEEWIKGVEMKADACTGEIRKVVTEFVNAISEDL